MPKLQAYIADGSASLEQGYYVSAGLVSTREGWASLAEEWKGLRGLEAASREPAAAGDGRNAAESEQKMQVLLDLIQKKRAMYRLDAVTKCINYDRYFRGNVPAEIDSVHFVLFFNLILGACKLLDLENLDGTVEFLFDARGGMSQSDAVRWHSWIKDHPMVAAHIKERMGSEPEFVDGETVAPMQTAAVYAAQVGRYFNEELPKKRRASPWLTSVAKIYGVSSYIEQKDVATLVYSIQRGLCLDSHCGPAAGFLGFSPDIIAS